MNSCYRGDEAFFMALLALLALQLALAARDAEPCLAQLRLEGSDGENCSVSPPVANDADDPVVYLHFHKAAGTTACDAFKKGVLRTFAAAPHDTNCNCESPEFLHALRAGDGAKVASFMREAGVDVKGVPAEERRARALEFVNAVLLPGMILDTSRDETWDQVVDLGHRRRSRKSSRRGVGCCDSSALRRGR